MNGFLDKVPFEDVKKFETEFLDILRMKEHNTLDQLSRGEWNDDILKILSQEASSVAAKYIIKNKNNE